MIALARRKPTGIPILDDLPMTPMIDVVFQLIIFFMLMPMERTIEGRLYSQLPKRGVDPSPAPPREELRIVLRRAGNDGETVIRIGRNDIGVLRRSIVGGNDERDKDAATINRQVLREAAGRIDEFYRLLPASRHPGQPNIVVIDSVSDIPWEHVIGIVDACKTKGIEQIQLTADPRFQ